MKKVYVILIYYKSKEVTIDCLNSFLEIGIRNINLEVIVVDNYPEDRIEIDLDKYKKLGLKVIQSPQNSGFSGGMNIGIKEALKNEADYILIHNNDTIMKSDFLEKLVEFANDTKEAGIIAPKIYFAKGYEFHKDRYEKNDLGKVFWYAGGRMDWQNVIGHHIGVDEVDHGQYDNIVETDFASGCSMLVRKELFKKVGIFDEKYFLYYEDNDLSQRAKKANFKIYYLPTSIVWHKNAGSAGGSGSKLQDYYITRNRLLFGNKFAPIRSRIALNREGLSLIRNGRHWQKAGVKDYFLRRFGKSNYF